MLMRHAGNTLKRLSKCFPVVAITGPRQSGKTTLARMLFNEKPYVSLENPDDREFAETDPKRFLARFPDGAILDEIQRVPALLSWLQGHVDQRGIMGDFIITGSAQFQLMAGISQSLAGRVGRVELLPLSIRELREHGSLHEDLDRHMLTGGYPAIYDRHIHPNDWFTNYVATYIERDVRQLIAVRDLQQFQRFLKLCAARSGQLLNLTSLGNDCGISGVTAREWLGVLETSYLAIRLPPYFQNFGKRLLKSPKLYFLDVGLMAWLLGIRDARMMETHPARGALFETLILSEIMKQRFNEGQPLDTYFWRDNKGDEVDFLIEGDQGLRAIEVKSGSTFASDWMKGLTLFQKLSGNQAKPLVIYGGAENFEREAADVIGWKDFGAEN